MKTGNDYVLFSVRELAQYIPEDKLRKALEEFECSRDSSIERFVRNESLEFAEDMYGTTYIFVSSEAWKKESLLYWAFLRSLLRQRISAGFQNLNIKGFLGIRLAGKRVHIVEHGCSVNSRALTE